MTIGSKAGAPGGARLVQEALDAAVRGIAGLAPVDDVLQIIVDRVRPLVGARYAALGIVDVEGHIERFITSGIDDATRRRIGALPEGRQPAPEHLVDPSDRARSLVPEHLQDLQFLFARRRSLGHDRLAPSDFSDTLS